MPMPVTLTPTEIEDALEVHCGVFRDDRGFFMETYSQVMWSRAAFAPVFLQDCMSLSRKGTLRGLHYQIDPHAMGKLVRAVTGSVFDVGVDLRRGSPSFGKWVARVLSAENGLALWIPGGFAHGFVALEDNTMVYYKCTAIHTPESERCLNYKDPAIGIQWPIAPTVITQKDAAAPFLADADYNFTYSGRR